MDRFRAVALAVGALIALGGCLSSPTGDAPGKDTENGTPDEPVEVEAYRSLCPQTSTERSGEVCYATIRDPSRALYEPYAAVHPDDPEIQAIGANTRVATALPGSGQEMLVYVTENGGTDWKTRSLPAFDGRTWFGDPALAFDASGRLHVAGMVDAGDNSNGFDVGYAASDDLGATWRSQQLVGSNGTADRPWLGLGNGGTVAIVWSDLLSFNYTISQDAGATWTPESSGTVNGCELPSRPVVRGGVVIVACFDGDAFPMYSLGPDATNATLLAELSPEGAHPWHLVDGLDAGLGLVTSPAGGNDILLRTSADARNWSTPASLNEAIDANQDWLATEVFWAQPDPYGNLHLLLREDRDHPADGDLDPDGPREVAWVIVDATGPTVLDERLITHARAPSEIASQRDDIDPEPNLNHAFGLAFRGDRGLLAWAEDGEIRTSLVQASGGDATSRPVATLSTSAGDPSLSCLEDDRQELPRTGRIAAPSDHLSVQISVDPGHPPVQVGYAVAGTQAWLPPVSQDANETLHLPVWAPQLETGQDAETWTFHQRTLVGPDGACSTGLGTGEARTAVYALASRLGGGTGGS